MPTAAPAAAPTPIPMALPELYPPDGGGYPPVPPVPPDPPVPPPPPYWADAAPHTAKESVATPVKRTSQCENITFLLFLMFPEVENLNRWFRLGPFFSPKARTRSAGYPGS